MGSFAPVRAESGRVRVDLPPDHPGVHDPGYRARRDAIAGLALAWRPGQPVPVVPYTAAEHAVWRTVSAELAALHRRHACAAARDGGRRLALPRDRIPQLPEVTQALGGFTFLPAAGLVPLREFYGSLADRTFWSTQYIRHHSVPRYTPEPDVVHEVIGHATTLANADYVELYVAAGRAARRVQGAAALEFVSRVFWFSLEFGVVREPDGWKAYGAGLLSSFGELPLIGAAEIRPLEVARMGAQDYDITRYQPVLFGAPSWSAVLDAVGGFFDTVTDDEVERMRVASRA